MNDLRELYEEVILDHNRNPRNFGRRPPECNRAAHGHNPLCGDQVEVSMTLRDGVIEDIAFDGEGCAISTASASMMTQALKGRTGKEARSLFDAMHAVLVEEAEPDHDRLGKLAALLGVKDFPMRVKCATLPWHTMEAALEGRDAPVTTE
ncbi:MAG: SUF system NifU family Fe-S cluster assembly protein [Immundisolibacterales bacterium]|nr:SUF system NifU family Fe-S cluster assembly protein [Immundisolibacterales bacterium]